jgi:hypothetical protein
VIVQVRELDHACEPARGATGIGDPQHMELVGLARGAGQQAQRGQLDLREALVEELRHARRGSLEHVVEPRQRPRLGRHHRGDAGHVLDEQLAVSITLLHMAVVGDVACHHGVHDVVSSNHPVRRMPVPGSLPSLAPTSNP